jgi:hypothetical protein
MTPEVCVKVQAEPCSTTGLPFFEVGFEDETGSGTKCSECGEILFYEAP